MGGILSDTSQGIENMEFSIWHGKAVNL